MRKIFLFVVSSVAFFCSCQKIESDYVRGPEPKTEMEGRVTLGRRLKNAYSMPNMRKAYRRYYGVGAGEERVYPTHYYVCFTEPSRRLVECLVSDSTVDAFPFPLDYELVGTGVYVPPSGQQGWVYAVIPVGWPHLRDFVCSVIDTCCIPDEHSALFEVERLSLYLTGNMTRSDFESVDDDTSSSMTRVSGRPHGMFRVLNTATRQNEAVRSVKVKCNSLVRVKNAWTREDGSYDCDMRFYTNVNYTLFFENRSGFQIWNNNWCLLPATLSLGVHSPHGYSYDMGTSSYGWRLSTINNSVKTYKDLICPHFGLDNPVNGLRISMITLSGLQWGASTPMWRRRNVADTEIGSFAGMLAVACGFWQYTLPDMMVFTSSKSTLWIHQLLFHELSHVVHYDKAGNVYWDRYVANIVHNLGYGDGTSHSDYIGVGEMWGGYMEYEAYNYYWHDIRGVDQLSSVPQSDEWYRPDLLKRVVDTVPLTPYFIKECLTSDDTSFATLKTKINSQLLPWAQEKVNCVLYPLFE